MLVNAQAKGIGCLFLVVFLFLSCTIQKKRFSFGYHIEFVSLKHLAKPKNSTIEKPTDKPVAKSALVQPNYIKSIPLSLVFSKKATEHFSTKHAVAFHTSQQAKAIKNDTLKTTAYYHTHQTNTKNMSTNTTNYSKRKTALLIGLSLLFMAVIAGVAVPILTSLFVSGNEVATAANIIAQYSKYMAAVVAWLAIFMLDILVSLGIYSYYKKDKKNLATATSTLRLIYTAILGVGIFQLLLNTPSTATNAIYQHIHLFNKFWGIGLIVFGAHLIMLGILFKHEGGKKWVTTTIKSLLILGGIGYMIQYIGVLVVANPTAYAKVVESIFMVFMITGEVFYAIWKIVKGGKTQH